MSILATSNRVFQIVVFSLLLDLVDDRVRRIERVFRPIVFVDLSGCWSCLDGRFGRCRFLLATLLDKE